MPKHLVFAGGGPRTLVFLSAIEVLTKHKLLDGVKNYWGNSSGALLATLLSINTPLPKIRALFETFDFTKLRDIELSNIMAFGENWGLDSGTAFYKNVRGVLEDIKPGSSDYTLQEVPSLHITATDLTAGKAVVLDSKSAPTLKIVDALRASTSIPFFYVPFRNPINNHIMVDGAVGCNFPWMLLPSDNDRKDALGFDYHTNSSQNGITNMSDFIAGVLHFRDRMWNSSVLKPVGPNILRFQVTGFPAWHLALKKEDRDELFSIGHKFTETWIVEHSSSKTPGAPPPSAHRHTPQQSSPSDHTGLSLGSHEHSHPSSPPYPPPHSPSGYQPSKRRWSV
jgi:predicted acylesterase/phospholipase RssA